MTTIDAQRIESNWRAIQIELDAPQPSWPERLLRRFGVPSGVARLVAATPALRRSWFGALVLVIVAGLGAFDATQPRESLFVFLLLAPLIPVFGASLAFGVDADPAHEIAVATPTRGLRLVVVRAATTLGVSLLALAGTALLAPERSAYAFAWLLPSFALTGVALLFMTITTPRRAGVITALGWFLTLAMVGGVADDRLASFGVAGQMAAIAVTIGAGVFTVARREQFDQIAARR